MTSDNGHKSGNYEYQTANGYVLIQFYELILISDDYKDLPFFAKSGHNRKASFIKDGISLNSRHSICYSNFKISGLFIEAFIVRSILAFLRFIKIAYLIVFCFIITSIFKANAHSESTEHKARDSRNKR